MGISRCISHPLSGIHLVMHVIQVLASISLNMNISFTFSQAAFSSSCGVVVMTMDFKTKGCEFKTHPMLISHFIMIIFMQIFTLFFKHLIRNSFEKLIKEKLKKI